MKRGPDVSRPCLRVFPFPNLSHRPRPLLIICHGQNVPNRPQLIWELCDAAARYFWIEISRAQGDKPGVIEEGLKEVHRRGRRRDPDDDELAVAKQLLRNRVSRPRRGNIWGPLKLRTL
jgi:hypothetical protein